ncbi:MAG: hypothetical protein IKV60_04420 [Rikenellaceae bacterium]|nr:hypothetical protein [Rikenellaceae bacterium]
MKRIMLWMALMMCAITTQAQTPEESQNWYAPSEVGTILKYAIYDQNGNITGHYVVRTDSVTRKANGQWCVSQSSLQYDANYRQIGDRLYAESIISNDTTYIGVNRIMEMSRATVQSWGTLIAIPASVNRYTSFVNRSLGCTVRVASFKFNATTKAYNYQLMGEETMTVDNRIYEALKISYETITKVVGHTEQSYATTWFAKGIGTMLAVVENEQTGESNTTKLMSIEFPSNSVSQ